ncbi:PocR ligand-binding domain-containing protein [Acetobacterium carbinolicum]|uniref:PocR ligand-binding domain-containing protein n=1 Tax=Acetobacterium carbinolicum TaxID=52690 RepID=UPI0039BFAC02
MHVIHLTDLVSVEILEDLLQQYYEATGMASSIVDFQGRTITSHKFLPVCELIRSVPELEKLCIQSDAYAGLTASITREPYIYQCPCGLIDCAVPIFVEETCVGQIMTGQVLIIDEDLEKVPKIFDFLPDIFKNIDTFHYTDIYQEKLLALSLKEITAYTKLLKIIAQLISVMGYQNILNERYKEQKIKLLEEKKEIAETKANVAKLKFNLLENQLPITFLIESFNSIYQQAIIEEATETADIIFSISSLLRRTLYRKESLVPLEEEIDYIQNYINIKNLSRSFKVSIEEQINQECAKKNIPITLIQSIVEHLFFINIDKLNISSIITISAIEMDSKMILELSCNHVKLPIVNIKETKNRNILSSLFSRTTCLTLNNLLHMLSAFYNESYDITIAETEDNYGKILISLPLNLE